MKGPSSSATWAKCFVYLASTSSNEPCQGQLSRDRLVQDQAVFSNPCDFLREQEQLRAKIRQFHEGEEGASLSTSIFAENIGFLRDSCRFAC